MISLDPFPQLAMKLKPRSHIGSAATSERLRKTLAFLSMRGECGATTNEIHEATKSDCVHSDISALRMEEDAEGKRLYNIPPAKFEKKNENGCKVYRYRIIQERKAVCRS